MRITFVLPNYPLRPVGGFKVVYEYANQLVTRGHELTVIHARRLRNDPPGLPLGAKMRRWIAPWIKKFIVPSVHWHRIDPRVKLMFVGEPTESCAPDADAVFATHWQTVDYVASYHQRKGVKLFFIQGYEVMEGNSAQIDTRWRMDLHKVVISRWLKEIGLQIGVSAEQLTLIPNGIDHMIYRVVNSIRYRSRQHVLMLYHPDKWKGVADGLMAIRQVRTVDPEVRAVLFGAYKRPANLPPWVSYVENPSQEALIQLYNDSAIFLCPSHSEGWHLPQFEAMACGCAVVTTDCGGNRDFAIDGKTALVSPPGNSGMLAQNLMRVLNDDDLRIRLAEAGAKKVREFTWHDSADKLENLLISLADIKH